MDWLMSIASTTSMGLTIRSTTALTRIHGGSVNVSNNGMCFARRVPPKSASADTSTVRWLRFRRRPGGGLPCGPRRRTAGAKSVAEEIGAGHGLDGEPRRHRRDDGIEQGGGVGGSRVAVDGDAGLGAAIEDGEPGVEAGAAPGIRSHQHGILFRADSTGMPRGSPKTRLFTKFSRCLNAFGDRSKCGNSSLHTRAGLSRGTQCAGSGVSNDARARQRPSD